MEIATNGLLNTSSISKQATCTYHNLMSENFEQKLYCHVSILCVILGSRELGILFLHDRDQKGRESNNFILLVLLVFFTCEEVEILSIIYLCRSGVACI